MESIGQTEKTGGGLTTTSRCSSFILFKDKSDWFELKMYYKELTVSHLHSKCVLM